MGITILKDEVKLLENFGTVEVAQQDEILLQAGMKPAPEDNDIKEFLQISGPLAALIRSLITNVLDKYDKQKQGEYEMVGMVFKETNNKKVARRDVVLWSHKVLISSPNKSAHLVDC